MCRTYSLSVNFSRKLGCFEASIPLHKVGWESMIYIDGKIHHNCDFNSQISTMKIIKLPWKLSESLFSLGVLWLFSPRV